MNWTSILAWHVRAASLVGLIALPCFAAEAPPPSGPSYKVDYAWPKLPLPNNWVLGELGGLFIDAQDHIWIVQRPSTLFIWEKGASLKPPISTCCAPAPPVMEFDRDGNVLQAWGGPGDGYEWPTTEHGITVDHKGNVWIGGSATQTGPKGEHADGMVLKFTRQGKFLLQIGHAGPSKGDADTAQLSGAADISVDPAANEAFVADGYGNHRVIVFDADTGKFKRMWGAYGKPPADAKLGPYDPSAPPSTQFRNVHCITIAKDGLVYVCDRDNDRMQIFKKDGTFVAEHIYGKDTRPPGTVGAIAFWPDAKQSILALADIGNFQVRLVNRSDGGVLGTFGHFGNYSGQLNRMHQVAFDSAGNLYTAEAAGKRLQKWILTGAPPAK